VKQSGILTHNAVGKQFCDYFLLTLVSLRQGIITAPYPNNQPAPAPLRNSRIGISGHVEISGTRHAPHVIYNAPDLFIVTQQQPLQSNANTLFVRSIVLYQGKMVLSIINRWKLTGVTTTDSLTAATVSVRVNGNSTGTVAREVMDLNAVSDAKAVSSVYNSVNVSWANAGMSCFKDL